MKWFILFALTLSELGCVRNNRIHVQKNSTERDDIVTNAQFFREGDDKEAKEYFRRCIENNTDIGAYCLMRLAETDLALGNYRESKHNAKKVLVHEESLRVKALKKRATALLAKLSLRNGTSEEIIAVHEALLKVGVRENAEILETLIAQYRKQHADHKAKHYEKRILINFPTSKIAKNIFKKHGVIAFNLTEKEVERRQDNLIAAADFNQIFEDQKEYRKKGKMSPEFRARMDRIAIKSLVYNNDLEKALRYALKRVQKNEHPFAFENYAWVLGKANRLDEASSAHGQFLEHALDRDDKARGCFFKGYSLFELNRYEDAQKAWDECQVSLLDTEYDELSLWYHALSFLLHNKLSEANLGFSALAERFKKSKEREKYQFFHAYTLHKLKQQQKSIAAFNQLTAQENVSYYSLLARNYTHTTVAKTKALPSDALTKLASLVRNPDCLKAMRIADMDFHEEAKEIILNAKISRDEKFAVLQKMEQWKVVYERAFLTPKIKNNALVIEPSIRAAYPLPHEEFGLEASAKFNISMSLLYAIMRVESGFSNDALSPRGARGLMQIMPHVATHLASKMEFGDFEHDHLFQVKTSIELGGRLLRDLLTEFKKPYLAIAAYNAGEHHVRQWLKDFGELPEELFIERMPFKETREYVKKVLPSMSLYDALGGERLSLRL